MSPDTSLKSRVSRESVRALARHLEAFDPSFPTRRFVARATRGLDSLEVTARIALLDRLSPKVFEWTRRTVKRGDRVVLDKESPFARSPRVDITGAVTAASCSSTRRVGRSRTSTSSASTTDARFPAPSAGRLGVAFRKVTAMLSLRGKAMSNASRMTVRLDAATRRKVERLAAREGISLNQAVNRLLQQATDEGEAPPRRRRYRLKPRRVGFGFDIERARQLAAQMSDDRTLEKLKGIR